MTALTSEDVIDRFKCEVRDYYNKHTAISNQLKICDYNVDVVWYCETIANRKALLTVNGSNETYYEITYDGSCDAIYLEVYSKYDTVIITRSDQ